MLEGLHVIAAYSVQKVLTIMMLFGIKHCGKGKQDFLTRNDVLYLSNFLYWRGAILLNINPSSKENFDRHTVFLSLNCYYSVRCS